MKSLFLCATIFLLTGLTLPQKNVEELKGHWHQHINDAYEESQKTQKPIMALFTGSDWCKPCKALASNYFSSEAFEEWAVEHVVLLYLDAPIKKQMSKEHWQHVNGLRDKLNQGGFPSVIVFDAERETDTSYTFTEWGRVNGYDNDSSFIAELHGVMDR